MSSREPREARLGRLSFPLYAVPFRRMIGDPPDVDELIVAALVPPPVEVVRPEDLAHLTFSFVNLRFEAGAYGGYPVLVRKATNRPAFLVVDFHSQHVIERALFETAEGYMVKDPPRPLDLPEADAPKDPDAGNPLVFPPVPPADSEGLIPPPVFASLSGPSRLVFKVTTQVIPYTVDGLLAAIPHLDLSVAPHALPPIQRRRLKFADVLETDVDISPLFQAALAPFSRTTRGRRRIEAPEGPTRVAAELTALGRIRAAAAQLEYRFGTEAALNALNNASIGHRLGFATIIGGLVDRVPIRVLPPLPTSPSPTQTSIELPWRLLVSPNALGAFAHSPVAIEHEGRYELWHTRLGVRARDKEGKPILDDSGDPMVDERTPDLRTIRAIWARDYDILPTALDEPDFGFTSPPLGTNFPDAGGTQDRPPVRTSLNSRDRMMLVHETSNFHLKRKETQAWTPEAVATNRLLLTALGGWLDSRVLFETLPDGGLTIEEWKHRAALGRDHEVKVVYSGFLLPFGHKASLVKVTERKFADGPGGTTAYLFQRMFIIVREPERQFRTDTRTLPGRRRIDLVMPLGTVRILTRVTPPLDPPQTLLPKAAGGFLFEPRVLNAPFLFKIVAVDLESNVLEFSAPLVFMERDHNDTAVAPPPNDDKSILEVALNTYNTHNLVHREFNLRGQRVAYADSEQPDDTILATRSLTFDVDTAPFLGPPAVAQDEPRFVPVLQEAKAVVPAMSALAGAATPTRLGYPTHFAAQGFAGNAAQVFLEALDAPPMSFAGQGDRSGGFVTPSLNVKGLSRLTGPIGGDLDAAIADPGNFSVGGFFDGISAKLFGLIPLNELFGALGFSPDRVPKFVTQTLDIATTLKHNVERIRNAAQQQAAQLGAAATDLKSDVDALLADLTLLAGDPTNPPNLPGDLQAIAADLDPFIAAVNGASEAAVPQAQKQQLVGIAQRVKDQLEDAAAITAAAQALIQFAKGFKLPEVITARLDWSTELDPWPSGGNGAVFRPLNPQNHQPAQGKIVLAVEIQAPTRPGKEPSALVSCSLTPFDLRLIAPATFIVLHFEKIEFSIVPGKKPDVNVAFRDPDGIEFDGPLEFVNTLKDIIPFDGFSDPPYLDVSAEGVKSGFDLAIPDVAVGVFALTNISLGAHLKIPFIDESLETAFNFSTRENPFRLQVSLFAGGGFFGMTITPKEVRILEAAFEFGAAISVNLGVASGSVSIMAGIYFRLETEAGATEAQLTGYFRMRGEVDVLGLASACMEVYLELTYETATGKAVGRATITIEVEMFFLSFSVSIPCEKKFAGSNGDPSFVDVMGLPAAAPPGAVRPWDSYCRAFAED
jgi:hypothetical protein